MKLSDSVTQLKGVGPKMKERLERLRIYTTEDLISFYPKRYEDWTQITKIENLEYEMETAIYGRVIAAKEVYPRRNMSILTVTLADGTGAANLVYFNQPWKKEQFVQGEYILAYGKIEYNYRKWQLSNPDTESVLPENLGKFQKLVPVYPLTEGIRMGQMRNMIVAALDKIEGVKENLPYDTVVREKLMNRLEAIRIMHSPENLDRQKAARRRLAFEELFYMQAGLQILRRNREKNTAGIKCMPSGELVRTVIGEFPFTLTKGQKQAFEDIEDDMEGKVPMQRLIQGDVGSGKTAVAALALAKIVENGYQGALMAPTEVLASQHFKTFQKIFSNLSVKVGYLSGQTKTGDRKEILSQLRHGDINILIGTHALLEKDVLFSDLGLVITDEQHRFGVKQRRALEDKGEMPHVLIMTATPIPRTMALSVYGDLDVSSIKGLPPGRKPVKTYAIGHDMLPRIFRFMEKEITAGHQVYVVCPLVEESEKQDLAAAVSVYRNLKEKIFPQFGVGLIHGRMKNTEKEQVMTDFYYKSLQLLVATSVIEVGINVPNATIMFIYGADRFGLSQLHQLRGRVGRGDSQAYCILYSDNQNETTQLRLQLMCEIQDGFLLSEKDLLLRGAGEFFGYHQHGMPDLKVADIVRDLPLLETAKKEASAAVEKEFDVKEELRHRFGGHFFEKIYATQ